MAKRKHVTYCSVNGCFNTSQLNPEVTFFSVPTAEASRNEWLRLIGRTQYIGEELKSRCRKVCEDHFAVQDVLRTSYRKKLKTGTLPTLCLPQNTSSKRSSSKLKSKKATSCSSLESESTKGRLESKLTQTGDENYIPTYASIEIQVSNRSGIRWHRDSSSPEPSENIPGKKVKEQSTFYQLCDSLLSEESAQLIKAQSNLKYISHKNRQDYKQFCLNLYYTSPQAYELLQSALNLPTASTLVRQNIKLEDEIMLLKARIDKMTDKEKNCSVLVSLVTLKSQLCYNIKKDKIFGFQEIDGIQSPEPAEKALIIMIRGIFSNWKHSVRYALFSERGNEDKIQSWIIKLLESLFDIGLNVRVLITDLGNCFMALSKNIIFSTENPYFTVKNRKIYYLFDTPKLIKSVRNHFLQHDFHFQGKVAKYKHIVQFYNEDQMRKSPLASKLTDSHIHQTITKKIPVEYAVQLFSKSVAAGLSTYVDFNVIETSGKDTAEFIAKINDLFDVLNSSKTHNIDEKYKKPFRGEEYQKAFLDEMLDFLKKLKLVNSRNGRDTTSTVKFIRGFTITIKSILLLYDDLKREGHRLLLTRNLNQDALEIFVTRMSTKTTKSMKLTSLQWASAYRKLYFLYTKKFIQEGNCKKELEKFLLQANSVEDEIAQDESLDDNMSLNSETDDNTESKDENNIIVSADYNKINTAEKHTLFYICEYMLMVCGENHGDCKTLHSYLMSDERYIGSSKKYQRYKQYSQNKSESLMVIPCDNFVKFVETMETVFVETFRRPCIKDNISESLFNEINQISFSPPCPCFPTTFLKKLFIRIRIYYTIKVNNQIFRTSKKSLKTFTIPTIL